MRGVSDCFLCLCDLTGLSSYSVKTFEAAGAHVSDPTFVTGTTYLKCFTSARFLDRARFCFKQAQVYVEAHKSWHTLAVLTAVG